MQSSVKRQRVEEMLSGMLLIKIASSKGPRMKLCGTPDITGTQGDELTATTVYWNKLFKKDSIHDSTDASSKRHESLAINPLWGMQLKALESQGK